jgi:uncharacterized protein involved in outer membrane biogenesis
VKKHLLWLLPPLALLAALAAGLAALPNFASAPKHRAAIESLASSLTGRQVHIGGHLSLGLFPAPELTATQVTITGPDAETIQAHSLALALSLPALLHGQLSATSLVLDSPVIAFPWPLPGGPRAVAPPTWLTALHAELHNGDISLGSVRATHIEADIFTSTGGSVTIAGTGNLQGQNLTLSAALGAIALTGSAPLTVDASSAGLALHLTGNLDNSGTYTGQLNLTAPQLTGSASVIASGNTLTATTLHLTRANTTLTGNATLTLSPLALSATLNAQNPDFAQAQPWLTQWPSLPLTLTLSATNATLYGQTLPALQTNLDISPTGLIVHSMQATLPGSATLSGALSLTATGTLTGHANLSAPSLPALFTGLHLAPPNFWPSAQLSSDFSGTASQLTLTNLTGSLGADNLTGHLILTGPHAAGSLSFDQLDLTALTTWLAQKNALPAFTADGQITATRATYGPVPLTNLFLDGAFTDHLNLRRFSAALYHGQTAGSLTLDASGQITAARGFLSLPSAAPLRALLPAAWQPPAALLQPRLSVTFVAQGPATALATGAIATLGDFTLTASPLINLTQHTATGPLSLRHPEAIAALNLFGLSQGLAWPGAGSIALRATVTASPTQFGLPDFVLSLGSLTASGRLLQNNGTLTGQIDADTLAIPPIPSSLTLPWNSLSGLQGKITLTANRVLYAGAPILGRSLAALTFAPSQTSLNLTQASLAGGTLTGAITSTLSPTAAPALKATLSAANIDTSQLALPLSFPITLPSGTLTAQASLTATGYEPRIWAATLSGSANLTAKNGTLHGFNLAGIIQALHLPERSTALRHALASGTSRFTTLALSASLTHGNCTLTAASLSGPSGHAAASGSIDLFDNNLALTLLLQPDVSPGLSITTAVLGPWSAPQQYPQLKDALIWAPNN